MNLSDRTHVHTIQTTYTTIGLKPPKAVVDVFARAEKLTKGAADLGAVPVSLTDATTAAILANRPPATDADVQAAVAALTLASNHHLPGAITATALDVVRDTCLTHLDTIVGAWGEVFDQAAATLEKAHERIGDLALDDTTAILAKGGDVAAVWASAKTADRTIEAINSGWTALVQFTRAVQINPDFRVLQLSAVDYRTWTARDLRRKNLKPWEFLLNDLALSLPTAAEYRARVQKIMDGMTRVETVVDPQRSMVAGREIRVPA